MLIKYYNLIEYIYPCVNKVIILFNQINNCLQPYN